MSTVTVVDPTTAQEVASYPEHSPEQIEAAVAAADAAFREWRRRPIEERGALLTAVAAGLRERADELARLVVSEMGKPLAEARFEIEKSAAACEYFAETAPGILADQTVDAGAGQHTVTYEPIGIIFAVMPWNFPFWQVIRFAGPALMAGNTALLKHAPNVSGTALALEEVFTAAGAPAGVFTSLIVAPENVPDVSARLIADPRVAAVTLTGSERAGAFVAAEAGKALKKSVLELGGSDPFVVLADADLDLAVKHAVTGRLMTAGQTCIAPKRFLVDETVVGDFQTKLVEALEAVTIGDPREEGVGLVRSPARTSSRTWSAKWPPRSPRARSSRRAARAWTSPALLPADRAGRRQARDDGVRRGDVRSGRRDHAVRHRGRGRRARQRHALRARRDRVDPGRRARRGPRPADRVRPGVGERARRV